MQSSGSLQMSRQVLRLCSSSGPATCLGSVFSSTTLNNCLQYNAPSLLLGGIRLIYSKKINDKWIRSWDEKREGIYYEGFTYFPRFPDQKDPPIEPSKLFMVKRIRSLYGCPIWEKKMIFKLNLAKRRTTAVVKNTPENNKLLYKIKHLIEITPITTPHGMPESADNTFMKDNGEFIRHNLLSDHGEVSLEQAEKLEDERKKKHLDGPTLRNRLHKRWYSRFDVI